MNNNQIGSAVPVGAVIVYAGNESFIQQLDGWLVCNGSDVDKLTHPELFAAIGWTNGGNGTDKFFLPNYQGYFLRGVDQGANHDPNAGARTVPASLGNSGDNPGSIQAFATAQPASNPFQVQIARGVPTSSRIGNDGALTGTHMSKWNSHSVAVPLDGGPKETRPKNKYVYFIIKSSSQTKQGSAVSIPVGSVVPFAGTNTINLGQQWLLCNGRQMNVASLQNKPLFDAIGIIHGGNGVTNFYLPDYQGYFLRGVSNHSGNDPDARDRVAPQKSLPIGEQGASGDNVGSMQYEQTAQAKNPFTVNVTHLPTAKKLEITVSDGHDNARWKEEPQHMDSIIYGGGNESRPVNAYVDWYIKAF